jgi:hypothetical protein
MARSLPSIVGKTAVGVASELLLSKTPAIGDIIEGAPFISPGYNYNDKGELEFRVFDSSSTGPWVVAVGSAIGYGIHISASNRADMLRTGARGLTEVAAFTLRNNWPPTKDSTNYFKTVGKWTDRALAWNAEADKLSRISRIAGVGARVLGKVFAAYALAETVYTAGKIAVQETSTAYQDCRKKCAAKLNVVSNGVGCSGGSK